MPDSTVLNDTILIVDDEESVRTTFREWLESGNLGSTILAAADAESALTLANQRLFRYLLRTTRASDGVLLLRSYDASRQPDEIFQVFNTQGELLDTPLVPFARSVAGTVATLQEPYAMRLVEGLHAGSSIQL